MVRNEQHTILVTQFQLIKYVAKIEQQILSVKNCVEEIIARQTLPVGQWAEFSILCQPVLQSSL